MMLNPSRPLPAPLPDVEQRSAGVWPLPEISLRRCAMKPPLRTKSVGTKVSEAEFAMLEERGGVKCWIDDIFACTFSEVASILLIHQHLKQDMNPSLPQNVKGVQDNSILDSSQESRMEVSDIVAAVGESTLGRRTTLPMCTIQFCNLKLPFGI